MPVARGQNYYQVLGLAQDASTDDIRKAYRKLARQYHPDVNGGDAEATEKFKEINRAYEVLSNAEKRARYDRFGEGGVNGDAPSNPTDFGFGGGSGGGAGGGFSDIFDVLFGAAAGGGARTPTERGAERGADLRADIEITLEEVLGGATRTIPVTRLESCSECKGNGAKPGTKPQPCAACAGSGYLRQARQTIFGTMSQVSECYRCHGRGEIVTDACGRCAGKGRERQSRRLEVQVPPGAEERSRIRLTGQGEAGPDGGPPGDLYVFLHVKPHPRFRRQGRDVMSEIEVSFVRATLGGPVDVPTLDGVEPLTVPEGTQPGDVFRLRSRGLPDLTRPQSRGDQHVVVRVKTPTHLNEKQKRLLQEFAEVSGEDLGKGAVAGQHNEGGFFEWMRNLFTGHQDDQH